MESNIASPRFDGWTGTSGRLRPAYGTLATPCPEPAESRPCPGRCDYTLSKGFRSQALIGMRLAARDAVEAARQAPLLRVPRLEFPLRADRHVKPVAHRGFTVKNVQNKYDEPQAFVKFLQEDPLPQLDAVSCPGRYTSMNVHIFQPSARGGFRAKARIRPGAADHGPSQRTHRSACAISADPVVVTLALLRH